MTGKLNRAMGVVVVAVLEGSSGIRWWLTVRRTMTQRARSVTTAGLLKGPKEKRVRSSRRLCLTSSALSLISTWSIRISPKPALRGITRALSLMRKVNWLQVMPKWIRMLNEGTTKKIISRRCIGNVIDPSRLRSHMGASLEGIIGPSWCRCLRAFL